MAESLKLSVQLGQTPDVIYRAWLSSEGHSKMTGADATIDDTVGGKHSAWDGYIWGENLDLEPNRKIVQSWRTSHFPEDAADSKVVVHLEPIDGGTRVTIDHTEIPDGQGESYRGGWKQFYFDPMLAHFGGVEGAKEAAPEKKAAPKKKAAAKKAAPKKKAAAKKAAPKKKAAAKKAAPKKKAAAKKAAPKKKAAAKKAAPKKKAAAKKAAPKKKAVAKKR